MVMPRKEPEIKLCEGCGGLVIQPRWSNGKLDATFKHRRFCSHPCYTNWMRKQKAPTSNASRRRAQKMYKALKCERCSGKENLQRHHRDKNPMNNTKNNVVVLCWRCHHLSHTSRELQGM